jgi:integrase
METKGFSPGTPSPEDPMAADRATPNVDALTWSAEDYASSSQADGTRRTYDKSWTGFEAWCGEQGFCALPAAPQTVALFLAARADQGRRPATLSVTLSAIAQAHELAGHPSPTADLLVKKTWKGVRRRLGIAPNKKDPISASELRSMMDRLPAGLLGLRDRALLLLGFAGGFRRSELVALNRRDLTFVTEGLEAFVTNSKTDQEGKGHIKMIAYGSDPSTCPVRAAKDWVELSGIVEGPVFRPIDRYEKLGAKALTDHAVAVIIKRTATRAGLATPELSGHSLRAGFVTEAARNGADYPSIMDQTGHENLTTVHGYNRRKDKWKKPASAKLGL